MCKLEQAELIALFAGELDEGDWLSEPCYTVPLCVEIARHVRPVSAVRLREAIYGPARPADAVPCLALEVIGLGYQRWVQNGRLTARRGR